MSGRRKLTSAGGRKHRLCTPKGSTNQLGGEIPTPLFDFSKVVKIEKIKNRFAHQNYRFLYFYEIQKSVKIKKRQKQKLEITDFSYLSVYTDKSDYDKLLMYWC